MVTGNDLQVEVVKLPPPTARPVLKILKNRWCPWIANCSLVDTISYIIYVIHAINQIFSSFQLLVIHYQFSLMEK